MKKIRIKLKSYDHKLLDQASRSITENVRSTGVQVTGPTPLPRRIEKFVVNRSPHVNKKSRQQFEIRTQTRLVVINTPTPHAVELLKKIDLPAGVDVKIEVIG